MISYEPVKENYETARCVFLSAGKMGFSRATYYSIMQGNSISTNTVNQLCKLLHCGVSDVIEYVEDDEY